MSLRRALYGQSMDGMAYFRWVQAGLQEGGVVPLSLGSLTARPGFVSGGVSGTWDAAGVDFYRLDDALQVTKPVFIRVTYFVLQTAYYPSRSALGLQVTLGTGFDAGAQALTGVMGSVLSGPPNADLNSAGAPDHMASSQARHGCVLTDPAGFVVSLRTSPHNASGYSFSASQALLSVERLRAADGSLDPRGRMLVIAGTGILTGTLFEYGLPPVTVSGPFFAAPTSGRDVMTGALHHFPPTYQGALGVLPGSRFVTLMGVDDAQSGLFELDHLGVRREFFVPSTGGTASSSPSGNLVTAFWSRDLS